MLKQTDWPGDSTLISEIVSHCMQWKALDEQQNHSSAYSPNAIFALSFRVICAARYNPVGVQRAPRVRLLFRIWTDKAAAKMEMRATPCGWSNKGVNDTEKKFGARKSAGITVLCKNFAPIQTSFKTANNVGGSLGCLCIYVCVFVSCRAELLREHIIYFFACTQSRKLKSQLRRSAGAEAATKRRRPTCLPTETHTRSIVANTHTQNRETKQKLCREAIQNAANGKRRNQSHEVVAGAK